LNGIGGQVDEDLLEPVAVPIHIDLIDLIQADALLPPERTFPASVISNRLTLLMASQFTGFCLRQEQQSADQRVDGALVVLAGIRVEAFHAAHQITLP
jgi:hypothetical protein